MEIALQLSHRSVRSVARVSAARFAVSALFLLNGALFGNWVSRIPAIQLQYGWSHGELGLALLVIAAGALVAMPLAGWLMAQFGSIRVCKTSATVYGLMLPLLAWAPTSFACMVVMFCFGAAHGALDVAMNTQATRVEAQYRRPIMSSFHAFFSLGGLLGASTGGLFAMAQFAPGLHFSIVAALLLAFVAIFVYPRLFNDVETLKQEPKQHSSWEPAWPKPILIVLGILAFCTMIGEGAMADWSAVYLRQVTGSSEAVATAGYAAFSIAMAAFRLVGDQLVQHLGPVKLVRSGGTLAVAGMALVLVATNPAWTLLGFALVGAGFATVVPLVFSAAGRNSSGASGSSIATVSTLGYLGFLIGPPAIGFMAEQFGLPLALHAIVVTSVLIVILAPSVRVGPLAQADTSNPQPLRSKSKRMTRSERCRLLTSALRHLYLP